MPSCWSDTPPLSGNATDLQQDGSILLAGGLGDPLHQVATQQQKSPSKSLQLSASPPDLHRHESVSPPSDQVLSAHLQQPSPVQHPIQSTALPAMHPAQRSPVKIGSQPGMIRRPQGCLRPNPAARVGKVCRAVPAAEKRSPLKGSNAWPPASPSPKKGIYGHSQNRAPVRGTGHSVPAFVQQPGADPMALHHRLR